MMSTESPITSPIAHTRVSRRWIGMHCVLVRLDDEFLDVPDLNYVGFTSGKPGKLDKADAEARRVTAARRNRSPVTPTLLSLAIAAALLLTSCGCPSNASLDQQRHTGISSRWITVEPATEASHSTLRVRDADALTAQLPFISDLVRERLHSLTLESDDGAATVDISATEESCLRFLRDTIGAEMKAGRFLESADADEAAQVIVIDATIAEKLFPDSDPIGSSLTIGPRTLTVIGVITQKPSSGSGNFVLDAYLPLSSLDGLKPGNTDQSTASIDRIRLRVDRLEQVEDARTVIHGILNKLHPDEEFVLR